MKNISKVLLSGVLVVSIFGCANVDKYSSDVYTGSQAKEARQVRYGKIIDIRKVKIQASSDTTLGSVGGAAIGGVLGSNVGGGTGSILASITGGIIGTIVGDQVQKKANLIDAQQMTIKLNNGKTFAVVQRYNSALVVGSKVQVIGDNNDLNVLPL